MAGQYVVGPETARMLELGHPWVIADRYTRRWPAGKAGEMIQVNDQQGRVLATALLEPGDRIVARVLGRGSLVLNKNLLRDRIEAALELRRAHAELADSDVYRLINSEGDGLPGLTIEVYGDFLVVQYYAGGWKRHEHMLLEVLGDVLAPAGIYVKARPRETRRIEARGGGRQLVRLAAGKPAPRPLPVRENGLYFLVQLEEGLHTGLFLDQRRNRRDFMQQSCGMRVLNLFAFTGAFSVAAAAAGARRVVTVDASAAYIDQARENFLANGLNPEAHAFITGDCFAVLDDMAQRGEKFDVVLMDPPSFSTTRQSRFTTRGGTSDLVAKAMLLLPAGGLLVTSSNHQKIDLADYLKELRRGALQAGSDLRVIRTAGQGPDFPFPVTFPEGRYLKYICAVKA